MGVYVSARVCVLGCVLGCVRGLVSPFVFLVRQLGLRPIIS